MNAEQAYYIVHRGRPGHVKESRLVIGLTTAKTAAAMMLDRAKDERLPGLVGYTRGRVRQAASGAWHVQAGRYSLPL